MLVLTPTVNQQTGQPQINAAFTPGDLVAWWFLLAIDEIPINLSGKNVKITIGMKTPLVLSTQNGGIILTNAPGGQFQVNISSDTTANFTPGTYDYDVWVIDSAGESQYATGQVTVNQSVSSFP